MLTTKHHCGAEVDVDTNGFGRTIDVCRRCGVLRPGWQNDPPPTPAAPPLPPPTPEPVMAKIVKKCQRSGKEFSAKGPAQKWCGTCPECREAAAEKTPAPKKKPAKPQAQAEETPRPKRATGFSRARSTPSASGIDLSGAIGKIEEQIAALDAQRERLLGAIESLRAIEAA